MVLEIEKYRRLVLSQFKEDIVIIVNWLLFENRIGVYKFVRGSNGEVCVMYKKFSQPENFFVVRARGKNLAENFLDIAAEVDDLMPLDVVVIAYRLGIPIPEQILNNLLDSATLIDKLAEQLGIE